MRPVDTGLNEEQKISQLSNFIDLILVRKWAIICHANLCNFECQIVNVKFINPNVCFWFFILRPVCNSHLSWAEFLLLLFFLSPNLQRSLQAWHEKNSEFGPVRCQVWPAGTICDHQLTGNAGILQRWPVVARWSNMWPVWPEETGYRCFQCRFWANFVSL